MSKGNRDRERAAARRIVEQQKAAARRRKVTVWTSVAVVAVLLIAGLIGWGVYAGQRRTDAHVTPSVAVDGGTAFAVGTGPVTVDLYEDFMCPICHEFETTDGATIDQLVSDKKVTVAVPHGVDPGPRLERHRILDAGGRRGGRGGRRRQVQGVPRRSLPEPAGGEQRRPDRRQADRAGQVGRARRRLRPAVNAKTYEAWVGKVTDTFSARGFTGTPTVVVAGKQVKGSTGSVPSPDDLAKAVDAAAAMPAS